jgi:hypothetical protein
MKRKRGDDPIQHIILGNSPCSCLKQAKMSVFFLLQKCKTEDGICPAWENGVGYSGSGSWWRKCVGG